MKRTDTKEIILNEALKLFAKKGYEAVGVADIAEAVGIKAPSLYKHYKSKKDIFDSIINRVNEMDREQAKEYEMPEETIEEAAESYKNISFEKICEYTKAMFLHWTKDEFSSNFRKLLTLEQYKNAEAESRYQQYISGGPAEYMADVFSSLTKSEEDAFCLAVEFYGPIYLLYSIYDGMSDMQLVMNLLEKHLDNFSEKLRLLCSEK